MSVLRFARKSCHLCGTECLDTDPRCWACGGWLFDPSAASDGPEPTLIGDDAPPEATIVSRAGPPASWWRSAALAGAALAFAGGIGFFVGRRSAGSLAPVVTDPPRAYTSQQLPRPAVDLRVRGGPTVEIYPRDFGAQFAPLQPRHGPPSEKSPGEEASGLPPGPVVVRPPVPAGAPPLAVPGRSMAVRPPVPAPGPPPRLDLPEAARSAVVLLRNNTPQRVNLSFTGFNGASDQMVSMAPGAAFEMPIDAGDYRLRVSGQDAVPTSVKAVFARRQRYELVIDGTPPADGQQLVLAVREPAIEGGR